MYQLRDDNIVWDELSPENIIIADLEQGKYTTLLGEGAALLWRLMISGVTVNDIAKTINDRCNIAPSNIDTLLSDIVTNLKEAGVLIAADTRNQSASDLIGEADKLSSFEVKLVCYDDMQHLLQLDPIDNAIELQ